MQRGIQIATLGLVVGLVTAGLIVVVDGSPLIAGVGAIGAAMPVVLIYTMLTLDAGAEADRHADEHV